MAQIGDPIERGIDCVYRHPGLPAHYVVADAKFGSAGLGKLADGRRQMSPSWIDERLPGAVPRSTVAEIDDVVYNPILLHVDKNGKVIER